VIDATDLGVLVKACEIDLGDPDLWSTPGGYPNSLALCIIDSIYLNGARYASVVNIIDRYRNYRKKHGGDADTDGTHELAATIFELGGPDPWATRIGNRRPTSTQAGAPLKAETIAGLTMLLPTYGVRNTGDLNALAVIGPDALKTVERAWRAAPGQRSGITWDYALMLAQIPGFKADRMVTRYVARAIGMRPEKLSPARAAQLVTRVAEIKGRNMVDLDQAIWRFESGRPFKHGEAVTP
jgi:hypothetical protein